VAAIYRMLGDLYLQSGANLQAQQSYQQAAQLAQAAGDIESQAAAQAGLGEADAALGLRDEAAPALQQALDNYTQLGDQPQMDAINARLKDLR
jgi:tetratricopeptide (TPR) repeat protein